MMHDATKAERRAARERVSAYYETELAKLIEHVEEAIGRYRAGEIDVHDMDGVIHRYSKAARELWKFCWSSGAEPTSCSSRGRSTSGRARRKRSIGGSK